MHLVCSKSNLLKSVNISLRAVPSRTTMSILECILIDASANEIKFTTNDMELGIETIVEGTILEKGIVAIDAKIFSDIIRKLPDNDVTIQTDDKLNVTISCEKALFTIPGKRGDDFSYLPVLERNEYITISQFALKEIIRQTIFSIAANENNKLMTGELIEIRNGELKETLNREFPGTVLCSVIDLKTENMRLFRKRLKLYVVYSLNISAATVVVKLQKI